MADKTPKEGAAAAPEGEAATTELTLLDRIIQDGKMARDESQQAYARDLVGEFVNQILDEGMTVSKDTVASIEARIAQIDEILSDQLNAILHDNISGIRQIKAYAAETAEHGRFNRYSEALRRATLRMMKWWAIYSPTMSFVRMTGYVFVLAFGGRAVMQGTLALGDFTAFFLSLSLFYEPIDRLNGLNQMILSGRAAADRVRLRPLSRRCRVGLVAYRHVTCPYARWLRRRTEGPGSRARTRSRANAGAGA